MAFNLTNKVFIVTGSASGMGLSTAKTLLERDASVAFCDINQSGLDAVISSISREQKAKALATSVDITNATAVSSFLQTAKQHFGKIDGIANFAGNGGHKLGLENVWETRPKEFDFIMDLNVKGLYHVLSEGLKPGYLEEPGSIVHISSMYSARGYKKGAVFSASKHAAVGMVKSAAIETGARGIRVNAVMPGGIDTPMYRAVRGNGSDHPTPGTPIPRPGTPEEIAAVVAFLLSEESTFVTGAAWGVDGGANA